MTRLLSPLAGLAAALVLAFAALSAAPAAADPPECESFAAEWRVMQQSGPLRPGRVESLRRRIPETCADLRAALDQAVAALDSEAGAQDAGPAAASRGLGRAPAARSAARPSVEARPVLVSLPRTRERTSLNGGHAVVLFVDDPAVSARNRALCDSLHRNFDDAGPDELATGLRQEGGRLLALRPVYWPVDERRPEGGGDRCQRRLAQYDYIRSGTIRRKLQIDGAQPYLAVISGDEAKSALINMASVPPGELDRTVQYFRDAFSREDRVWDASVFTPAKRGQSLLAFWPGQPPAALARAFGFVETSGCGVGDFFDRPC